VVRGEVDSKMVTITVSNTKAGVSALELVHKHWPKLQVLLGVVIILTVATGMSR
jgi:hypothetical protein